MKINENTKKGIYLSLIGFILFVIFRINGATNLLIQYLILLMSMVIALLTFISPKTIEEVLKKWIKVGEVVGKIVNPCIMGVIYYLIITPLALILKISGRDVLELRCNKKTFWRLKTEEVSTLEKFKRQY